MPGRRDKHLPDYLKDTTRQRGIKLGRRLGGGQGLIPRILVATQYAPLTWLVVPVGRNLQLYTRETNLYSRTQAAEIIRKAPAWCALQAGVKSLVHINIIMPTNAVPPRRDLPPGTSLHPIDEERGGLLGVVRYLSGPPDQRTGRTKDPRTGIKSDPTPENITAALLEYQEARSRGRLPRMQWTANLPTLRPDMPTAAVGTE